MRGGPPARPSLRRPMTMSGRAMEGVLVHPTDIDAGSVNRKVVPRGWLAIAHSLPP